MQIQETIKGFLSFKSDVGAIANQFAGGGKPGPKTRAFCAALVPILKSIKWLINQVWEASNYGTPNATERGGLIAFANDVGYFGKAYPGSEGDSNVSLKKGTWVYRELHPPRQTYSRPAIHVFDIHSHPFDTGQTIRIRGGERDGEIVKAGNVEKPSKGDMNGLDPSLIGIIVTKGRINIYTSVGRRCTFAR